MCLIFLASSLIAAQRYQLAHTDPGFAIPCGTAGNVIRRGRHVSLLAYYTRLSTYALPRPSRMAHIFEACQRDAEHTTTPEDCILSS
ncbi:hypothetical protein FKP32DRAFT_1594879 [Trametes sanguinea]|nr:hypothetical protein FKP32DRAFT_1594879 [Trametes sanguinea]